MKLINVAIAFSYAILANAQSAQNGECTNARSFKGIIRQGRHVTAEVYNANFDANLYKYLQAKQQNGDADTICSTKKEECAALLDHMDMDSFRAKTGGSRNCGKEADEVIDNLLGCALCERLNEIEEADAYCAEDSNSMACVSRSTQKECVLEGPTGGSMYACHQEQAEIVEAQSESNQRQEEDDGLKGAGKSASGKIKIFFSRCTGKVWNIVVSGGPEYCKDMFPKYPRVIHGKMKPGHPNYDAVVEIRDSCQALQNIVKQTRCFCLYVLWGCSTYPRPCGGSWKQKAASKREATICYYFSNLKGTGVYKPRHRPADTKCGKPGQGKPKPGAIINAMTDVMSQAKAKCKKFRNKKKKYNMCVKKQKKALS
jgi:hypothetical protein